MAPSSHRHIDAPHFVGQGGLAQRAAFLGAPATEY